MMRTTIAALGLLLLTPAAYAGDVTKDQAMAACDAATMAQKAASAVGMEWRDTDKIIKTTEQGFFMDVHGGSPSSRLWCKNNRESAAS